MKVNKNRTAITLKRVGYRIEGIAKLHMWMSGVGYIHMDAFELKVPDISLDISYDDLNDKIKENLNDAGFGCESIDGAVGSVYDLYEGGFTCYYGEYYVGDITSDDIDAIDIILGGI